MDKSCKREKTDRSAKHLIVNNLNQHKAAKNVNLYYQNTKNGNNNNNNNRNVLG